VIFDAVVLLAGTLAGAVAAVSGFGIGSLLTPLLATHVGTKVAVAAVSIPHVIGTAARFVKLREHVDRHAFIRFGILSAAGGLLGALINTRVNAPVLSIVLGVLLIFAGLSGLIGLAERVHLGPRTASAAGMLSGLFGGLVGNQGGIRSAALMGFDLSKEAFVATATAVALVVDGARLPVYLWTEGQSLTRLWPEIVAATVGVLLGTFAGVRVLRRIPERVFRPSVSILIIALGVYMLLARERGEARATVQPLDSPARPRSGEPNLTVGPHGRVLLSWIEKTGDNRHRLQLASRAAGDGWSTPMTIAEGADWFVNWADFPSVTALADGALFAHWLAKSGAGRYAYDVHVSRSRDGGKTWSGSVIPHRDGTQSEHGFVSMWPWGPRDVGIVWLDGRHSSASRPDGQGESVPAMSLMHTTLDRDGRLGAETVLDARVCDCCQTDAVTAAGVTVVVYRDRSEKEIRDMSVVRFADGRWSAPAVLAHDGWEINGCPVNGPAIAADGANVAAAWFTAAAGTPRVKVAFSTDAGATFGPPIAVDDGRPAGRVDVVALEDGAALVTWLEQTDKGASVRARRIASSGARGEAIVVADSSAARSSGFPRMVRSGREITLAWTDPADPPNVRTAVLSVPSR
jgi:uncharacterized membrane protein YfcA